MWRFIKLIREAQFKHKTTQSALQGHTITLEDIKNKHEYINDKTLKQVRKQ